MSDASEMRCTEARYEEPASVDMRAMTWLIELKTSEPDLPRWEEFENWLAASPDHEKTYYAFERLWEKLETKLSAAQWQEPSEDLAHASFFSLFKLLYEDACSSRAARQATMNERECELFGADGEATAANVRSVRQLWPAAPPRRREAPVVFISYSRSADKPAVRDIANRLRAQAFDPWIDAEDIYVGRGWTAVLENVLALCSFVLVIVSGRGHPLPKQTLQVLDVWKSRKEDRDRLIPIRLDNSRMHSSLSEFSHVDLFAESGWPSLIARLRGPVHWMDDACRAPRLPSRIEPYDTSPRRPSLDRKLAIFPQEIEKFLVDQQLSGCLDTAARNFIARTSCRLEPIVQVHPKTLERDLLGFQCLALGPSGENFSAILSRCETVNADVLRICVAITALETIAALRNDIDFRLQGRSRLKFLLHLDSHMLSSTLLMPFLNRYWDTLDNNVLFEVGAVTADRHYRQLQQLSEKLDISYVATDLNMWSDEARPALRKCIEITKMGYARFRAILRLGKTNMFESLSRLRMGQIADAPFIVSGLDRRNAVKLVEEFCSNRTSAEMFGQGDALDAAQKWSSKTPPLKVLGVQGSGRALLRSPG